MPPRTERKPEGIRGGIEGCKETTSTVESRSKKRKAKQGFVFAAGESFEDVEVAGTGDGRQG